MTTDMVLKKMGAFFLTYLLQHGYDKVLLTLGKDLVSFVHSVDSLHGLLAPSYEGMVPPSFRCVEHIDGTLTVHHYSWRQGLFPFLQGLLEMIAKELFNQQAKVTWISTERVEVNTSEFMYHTALQVELLDRRCGQGLVTGKFDNPSQPRIPRLWASGQDDYHTQIGCVLPVLSKEDLCEAFPYHVVLNDRLEVKQCGELIEEHAPFPVTSSTRFTDLFSLLWPRVAPTLHNIFRFINTVFIVSMDRGHDTVPLVLQGQCVWLLHCQHLMLMCTPHVRTLSDFRKMELTMADVPLAHSTREVVLLNQQRQAETDVAKKLDDTTTELRKTSEALEQEKLRAEELLQEMLPSKVARQLTLYGTVRAEKFQCVTVLFSDIVTFTSITSQCPAHHVVRMLNDMYQRFDRHSDHHGVYKVKTIGDAYMAVTGVPESQPHHAHAMADFAMDIMEEAARVTSPATGLPLKIRLGLHSGPVLAGVIGKKKPRYDIYGHTVNMAATMESSSVPGRINVSQDTFRQLSPCGYIFKDRGEVQVGGQGWLRLYFLTGSMDRSLVQPDDDFLVLPDVLDPAVEKQQARRQSCFPSLAETATDSETRATHGRAAGGPAAWDGLQAQQVCVADDEQTATAVELLHDAAVIGNLGISRPSPRPPAAAAAAATAERASRKRQTVPVSRETDGPGPHPPPHCPASGDPSCAARAQSGRHESLKKKHCTVS